MTNENREDDDVSVWFYCPVTSDVFTQAFCIIYFLTAYNYQPTVPLTAIYMVWTIPRPKLAINV